MTLVLYKNIDLCLALKKWNDYMGWGRILYLDLWVWESKRNGSPILISSDPLIEEGQRQKKNDRVSKSKLNVKKICFPPWAFPWSYFFFLGDFSVFFSIFFFCGVHPFCIYKIFTRFVFCLPFLSWANSQKTYMYYIRYDYV